MTLRQLFLVSAVLILLLASAVFSSYWFHQNFIGWLINDVPDAVQYRKQWQQVLDAQPELVHPAVIHYLPEGCLCRVLTLKHAQQLTRKASQNGFQVFQLNSADTNMGKPLSISNTQDFISPQIVITRPNGRIAYVGAYSDGIRCNTGNSLVDAFLDSVGTLPTHPVVGLDVQVCRCLPE